MAKPLIYPEYKLKEAARGLRGMGRRAVDISPVWPKVGAYLSRQTRIQFATRGARSGDKWKPLAPRTIQDKLRGGWPMAPLVRTHELKQSFVGRPMNVEVYYKNTAQFGSDLDKARWQHFGTFRHGRRHIPPRKIVVFTTADKAAIRQMIVDFINKGVK